MEKDNNVTYDLLYFYNPRNGINYGWIFEHTPNPHKKIRMSFRSLRAKMLKGEIPFDIVSNTFFLPNLIGKHKKIRFRFDQKKNKNSDKQKRLLSYRRNAYKRRRID